MARQWHWGTIGFKHGTQGEEHPLESGMNGGRCRTSAWGYEAKLLKVSPEKRTQSWKWIYPGRKLVGTDEV